VDKILQRNDFNLQLMATVPAFIVGTLLLMGLRQCWLRARTNSRLPLEEIRRELIDIEAALTRADGPHRSAREGRAALSHFEVVFAHPPISPICRTPLFPYLTF